MEKEDLKVFLLRHGQTYGNINQKVTEKDDPLTSTGILEAKRLSLDEEFLNM